MVAIVRFSSTRSTPLLLAKDFGARGDMRVNRAPVELKDIYSTILNGKGASNVDLFAKDLANRKRHYWFFEEKKRKAEEIWQKVVVDGHAWSAADWSPSNSVIARGDRWRQGLNSGIPLKSTLF